MSGRPRNDASPRIDPKTGEPLPSGIRYRSDCDQYQARVLVKQLDGRWAERSQLFHTLDAAKRGRRRLQRDPNAGNALTLERWHEQYWPMIEGSVRPATARAYAVSWRIRVQPSLGRMRLESITAPAIEAAMLRWSGAASTKKDALAVLSRLLDGAHRARLVNGNAARQVRAPKEASLGSLRPRALSPEQVFQLLDLVPDGCYRRFVAGLALTGVRCGEATALRVGDVDLAASVIHVCRSLSPGRNGELVEQAPKGNHDRFVPLCDMLRPYVEDAMRGKADAELLFDSLRGKHLTNRQLAKAVHWPELRDALGRPDLRLHDLRHTFATMLFDAGVPANDVQAILGHSSLLVTQRYAPARDGVATRVGRVLNRGGYGRYMAAAIERQFIAHHEEEKVLIRT